MFVATCGDLLTTSSACRMQARLVTCRFPEPPFDPDSNNPTNVMDTRIRTMQKVCFGRSLPKKQHTNRRDGAEEIVEKGCVS